MIPLYCVMMMKSYPSKYLTPVTIGLALVAVLVQSTMVEVFRDIPSMLNLTYGIIMVILVVVYLQLEPYFLYAFKRNIPVPDSEPDTGNKQEIDSDTVINNIQITSTVPDIQITSTVPDIQITSTVPENREIINNVGDKTDDMLKALTKRELEVLDLIACGYSNSEIAKTLFISEHTVNDYTKKIYKKLNVHSRYAAAQFVNNKNK
ncbi:MAG: helix-turn-helix transcriptional regulator [Clostridia bacterium]|nr:helix-turn-helix transcriptional regulator [Clostridia bacterium]